MMPPSKREKIVEFHTAPGRHPDGTWEHHMYPGTVHGFAARPTLSDKVILEAYEDALGRQERWFRKFVVDA
jgi:dienelactone hydrolase